MFIKKVFVINKNNIKVKLWKFATVCSVILKKCLSFYSETYYQINLNRSIKLIENVTKVLFNNKMVV